MHPSQIPVVGLVAASGTGKTTLLKKLIPVLRSRGIRVGFLKHSHHSFDVDRPGKDSYEIREAGAVQTLLASGDRWALQSAQRVPGEAPSLEEMIELFDPNRVDLILVEGFKFAAFPKIELHRAALENTLLYPDDPDIFAVVSDHSLAQKEHPPVLPLDDLDAIADFVLGRAEPAPPASVRLSEELVLHFRLLRVNGCNDSHSGNASALVDNGFWLTRAGACADTLISKDLLHCPLEGTCPVGTPDDALIHRQVYSQQPKARAVLHSHGPYSVAMSFAGQDFRPADFQAQYYFESVPVLNVPYEDYMDEAPQAVAEALAEHPICMVRGHGVYAWGETINIAYKWTTSLELSAKTYVIARQAASL